MTKYALLLQILWLSAVFRPSDAADGSAVYSDQQSQRLRSASEEIVYSRSLETDDEDGHTDDDELEALLFGDEESEEAEEVEDDDEEVDLHSILFDDDAAGETDDEDVDLHSILFDDDEVADDDLWADDDGATDDYYGKGKGKGKDSSSKGKGKGKGKGSSKSSGKGKGKGKGKGEGKGKGKGKGGKGKGKGASKGKGKGKGSRTDGIYPRYNDIAFLDDEYFDDAFFEDDDCELITFNETFSVPRAALFLAPDTTPTVPGDPSLPGTMFIWEDQEVFEGDGQNVVEGTRISGSCTRTLGTTASTDGAASCTLVFTDTEGFSINLEGILEGPFGSTLGITGGTGGMVGIIGEMDFMPIYAEGMGDILTDVTRYEVDGDLGIIVCP